MEKKSYTFTNSVGDTFRILPLNPLEEDLIRQSIAAEWKAAGKPLAELPSYTVETVTGEKQTIQVDSKEKAEGAGIATAWATYLAAKDAFDQEYMARFLDSCFLCVDDDPEKYPRWRMRMKVKQIPIPEDDGERFILFCKTWVIRSQDDIPGLIFAATKTMMNVSEEAMQAAEDMFRRTVEKAAGAIQFGQGAG
jgi:hypothetical protein